MGGTEVASSDQVLVGYLGDFIEGAQCFGFREGRRAEHQALHPGVGVAVDQGQIDRGERDGDRQVVCLESGQLGPVSRRDRLPRREASDLLRGVDDIALDQPGSNLHICVQVKPRTL